ncbi:MULTISPECIES: molybdopterin molybdotransferase MoeA [unclassified Luteibacter]|uniref:molybdopterin molybdotransferase MoeA n=1 Tax=unclassified Luteibacter TaxID=2620188 RepID=UPI0008C61058|nr:MULTISPECIES: molybdopterin molybdotransferase MoeA [unclassified Luteibacter]MDR6936694.1 molybdopterin molybdotransferase [Luteibacter sp. 3190]SEV83285.1 molybdopterin molybdotransferase [Luteibacter sp. 329MFSha]
MALLPIAEALEAYATAVRSLPTHRVPLELALGAVLAETPRARIALPRFTQSSVDGYAVRADDGTAQRRLVGTAAAGQPAAVAIGPGDAVRILTGGVLPEGADAVARQEIVERTGEGIVLREAVRKGEAIRYEGEELAAGAALAEPGRRIGAGLLAAMAMAGIDTVEVYRRPRIAVLVTGDEVVRAGEPLEPGQVYDANGPLLRAWFVENGYGEPVVAYVRDDETALEEAMSAALDSADLIVTSGGVSVGDRDFIPVVADRLGVRKVFWKVSQKPGKPLWFGMRDGRAMLGMPGNPAAVLVCLAVHARAVLARLEGEAEPQPAWRRGVLSGEVDADEERDRLVRMRLDLSDGTASLGLLPRQDSHMLSNLASAHALVWLPARRAPFAAGEKVRWLAI